MVRQITHYGFISGTDLAEITMAVQKSITEGWQPFGPPAVSPARAPGLVQTMVRYEPEEPAPHLTREQLNRLVDHATGRSFIQAAPVDPNQLDLFGVGATAQPEFVRAQAERTQETRDAVDAVTVPEAVAERLRNMDGDDKAQGDGDAQSK